MEPTNLTAEELARYDRQIGQGVLSAEGQLRLKCSTVLITRVGGMGGPASLSLTTAGVGNVIIAHGGELITPDLNRQILGCEDHIGQLRAPRFAEYLRSMNRFVNVEPLAYEPDDTQAEELAQRCDLIISCPPTFEERLRLNRAAVAAKIPFIDAAQWGMSGTLIVCKPGETACLQCVYPHEPEFEEFFPVVGAISSAIGALAALEAIKILSQCGKPMWGKMLMVDGFQATNNIIELRRNPDCPCCSQC